MTHLAMSVSFSALAHFNWASIAHVFATMSHSVMHAFDCGAISVG